MLSFWIGKLCVLDDDIISGGKKIRESRCDREGKTCFLVPLRCGLCTISRGIFLMLVSGLIIFVRNTKKASGLDYILDIY